MIKSNINCGQKITLCQDKSYCENCLPKTTNTVNKIRDILLKIVSKHNLPEEWMFEDKILVLICPDFRKQVDLYYSDKGLQMISIYSEDEIQKIDDIIDTALNKLFQEWKN